VYKLTKTHIGTLEAVAILARAWHVPRRLIGTAGLKDTHAQAEQFISIRGTAPPRFEGRDFTAEFVAKDHRPMTPARSSGNAFEITVRDLEETATFRKDLEEIAAHGLPNYFDAQRFGSAVDGEFPARKLVEGDYEGAMKLILPVRHKWGRWDELMKEMPRSSERSIVGYLRDHPTNFAGAFDRLDQALRFLILSAYQSFLWNEALAEAVRAAVPSKDLIERRIGPGRVVFFRALDATLPPIPLPRPKLRKIRRAWFGKGSRDAVVVPRKLCVLREEADALNPGRRALTFACEMPRGAYATLIVRRCFGSWKRGVALD
jgi:tRNA pseudouridine13 synthase